MKLLVHVMGWFGNNQIHRQDSYGGISGGIGSGNTYNSATPSVVANQINIMKSARVFGLPISGVIMTWQGPYSTFLHGACMQWCLQCQQRGLLFGLLMDPAIATAGPLPPTGSTPTDYVIQALKHGDVSGTGATSGLPSGTPVLTSGMVWQPCYLPEVFVLDDSTGADINAVQAAMNAASIPITVLAPPGSHSPQPTAGFGWPSIVMSIKNSQSRNANSVSGLQAQHALSTMKIPAVMMHFRDNGCPVATPYGPAPSPTAWQGDRDYTQSVWSTGTGPSYPFTSTGAGNSQGRNLDSQCGKLFLDYFATVPGSAPYLALVTWNDYDEGTDIEAFWSMTTGIRIGS